MNVSELILSPKTAGGVALTTTGTGLGTFLEAIPSDIGKLATLVGIVLSIVLIYVHLLNVRKVKLEIEILRQTQTSKTTDDHSQSAPSSLE